MSERLFNTEKVDNIIGLKDRNVYDKIDVFVDITNNNNIWGIVYYTEYKKNKPIIKQEIVRFQDNNAMNEYLRTNFNGYELDHPVDINHKQIFFHYVDYCDINYYYYDGKPNLNYVVIKVFEYINNNRVLNHIKLPKEYEEILVNVFKVSKKIPGTLPEKYHHDVDGYEEQRNNRKEIVRALTMSMEEFFSLTGTTIKKITSNKRLLRGLKILVSTVALSSLLAGGYNLVMDNEYNSDYLVQKGTAINMQDANIFMNKGKVGKYIELLMENKYDEISPDDMKYVIGYINDINESNFDNNASLNFFNYSDYFNYKLDIHVDYTEATRILKKIESLYSDCFRTINGKVTLIQENVDKYITYVGSLTFLYDTYHTDRAVSYVKVDSQSITSPFALASEVSVFDQFPSVLKYTIMNQLKGVLLRSNYELKTRPSYYFGETDKYSLLTELSKKSDKIVDSMYFECGYNTGMRAGK